MVEVERRAHRRRSTTPGPRRGRLARLRRAFRDADAVVFGHSHMPLHERDGGFQIFNPGSPTERRRAPIRAMGLADVERRCGPLPPRRALRSAAASSEPRPECGRITPAPRRTFSVPPRGGCCGRGARSRHALRYRSRDSRRALGAAAARSVGRVAKERLKSPRARLFVALDLPDDGARRARRLAGARALADPALRPMRPEALHVTLCFLGYHPEQAIAADRRAGRRGRAAAGRAALRARARRRCRRAGRACTRSAPRARPPSRFRPSSRPRSRPSASTSPRSAPSGPT